MFFFLTTPPFCLFYTNFKYILNAQSVASTTSRGKGFWLLLSLSVCMSVCHALYSKTNTIRSILFKFSRLNAQPVVCVFLSFFLLHQHFVHDVQIFNNQHTTWCRRLSFISHHHFIYFFIIFNTQCTICWWRRFLSYYIDILFISCKFSIINAQPIAEVLSILF